MSLSTRAIAALGAVVVIGAGTVGGSIAYATGEDQPISHQATLTVGRSSIHAEPFASCYNDGKPLGKDAVAKCQTDAKKAADNGELPGLDVRNSDRIGVGVDPGTADKGWFSFTDGGQQGQAPISSSRTNTTFSGMLPVSGLLAQGKKTTVTVVQADEKTGDILAAWYFTLDNKDYVAQAAPAQ
ncbi:hypothetical protein CFP65_4404 [Kitasatospora sp. MMS16-BH015]|uniref:hypothetical protein n=1 Tax=Kitasatospora sp. MMS16-BH015 TaxID=2018025 RepID=UPI000CA0A6AD|nr:hypothetical protein [Kitasatospora sp. MMS16-BH015]AUG79153.1 hypothetical protein CFP65_4404 [Kitasatospora sp. MMS16-BH015]